MIDISSMPVLNRSAVRYLMFNVTTSSPFSALIDDIEASNQISLLDTGLSGDAVAGDAIYTARYNVTRENNISDGIKTIIGLVTDEAGNSLAPSDTISLDNTPPKGTILINDGDTFTISRTVALNLSFSDATSGVKECRYSNFDPLTSNYESCQALKVWTTTSGGGTKTVFYEVKDNAGNFNVSNDTIILDTTVPLMSITNPQPYTPVNGTVNVSFTGAESAQPQVSIDGGNWSNTTTNSYYLWNTTNTSVAEGLHSVRIRDTDPAGNIGYSESLLVIVDNVPGVVTFIRPEDNQVLIGGVPVTVMATAPDNTVNLSFWINNGTHSFGVYNDSSPADGWNFTLDTSLYADGAWELGVNATDTFNRMFDTAKVAGLRFDNTAPTATLFTPANGATYKGTVIINATGSSDVKQAVFEYSNDSGVNWQPVGIDFSPILGWTFAWYTPAFGDASTYRVRVNLSDYAGLSTIAQNTADFTIDNNAPVITIVAPIGGSYVSGSALINWTGNASADSELSFDGRGWMNITNSTNYTWNTNSFADGTHTLQVRNNDSAGNVGYSNIVSVVVDNFKPVVTVISPRSNSTISGNYSVLVSPSSDTVRLDFHVDNGTGSGFAFLRTDSSRADGWDFLWDTSFNCATVGECNGSRLFINATDLSNQTANFTVSNLEIDNAAPVVSIVAPVAGTQVRGVQMVSASSSSDTVQVVFEYSPDSGTNWYVIGTDPGSASGWNITWDTKSVVNAATYRVRANATDNAGLSSASETNDFTIDNVAAATTIISPKAGSMVSGNFTVTTIAPDAAFFVLFKVFNQSTNFSTNGSLGFMNDSSPADGWTVKWNTTAFVDGLYNLSAVSYDVNGNYISNGTELGIRVDNTAPSAVVVTDLQKFRNSNVIPVNWTASSSNDVAYYNVYRSNNVSFILLPSLLVKNTTGTAVTDTVVDGLWFYKVTAVDTSGRESAASNEVNVTVITGAPPSEIFGTLAVNDSIVNNGSSILFTFAGSSTNLNVSINATEMGRLDNTSGNLMLNDSGLNGDIVVDDATYSAIYSISMLNNISDGLKQIVAEVNDSAANIFRPAVNITLDNTPPNATIIINGGDLFTAQRLVSLGMLFNDSNGIDRCRLSNENRQFSDWESCISSKVWQLSLLDGNKTVVFQARDNAGNVKESNSSIYLQAAGVSVGFVHPTPSDKSSLNSSNVGVNVTVGAQQGVSAFINWNSSLVAYYKFDDGSGSNATDSSGNSLHGNITNLTSDALWVPGVRGRALSFDGQSNYVNISFGQKMNLTNAVTVEFWFYGIAPGNFSTIFLSKGNYTKSATASFWFGYQNDSDLNFFVNNVSLAPTAWTGAVHISERTWVHVAGVYNGSNASLFINGVYANSSRRSLAPINMTGESLYLGRAYFATPNSDYGYGSWRFNGSLDELRIWNRALSPEEVNASFNANAGLFGNFSSLQEGNQSFYAYAVDSSGASAQTETRNILIDLTAPNASIVIFGLSPAGFANASTEYAYSRSVTLSVSANDSLAGVSTCRFANEDQAFTGWEGCQSSRSWLLSDGAGNKTVLVEVRDLAGNVNRTNDSIYFNVSAAGIDLSPPNRPTIVDDGTYTGIDSSLHARWNSTDYENDLMHIPLEWEYRIGFDNFSRHLNDTWQLVGTLTEVTVYGLNLSNGTNYTFEVRAINTAGIRSSNATSDGITVDTMAPSAPVVNATTAQNTWSSGNVVKFNWSSVDALSGIAYYSYLLDTNSTTVPDNVPEADNEHVLLATQQNDGKSTLLKFNNTGNASAVFVQVNSNVSADDVIRVTLQLSEASTESPDSMGYRVYVIPSVPTLFGMNGSNISLVVDTAQDIKYVSSLIDASSYVIEVPMSTSVTGSSFFVAVAGDLADDGNHHNLLLAVSNSTVDSSTQSYQCHESLGCSNTSSTAEYGIKVEIRDAKQDNIWDKTYTVGDGRLYFHVKARDNAGNVGEVANYTLLVDTSAPSTPQMNQTSQYTNVSSATFNWTQSTDADSGVGNYSLEVDNNSDFSSPEFYQWVGNVTNRTVTGLTSDATYFARVHSKNLAGVNSSWSSLSTAVIDTTAPNITFSKPSSSGVVASQSVVLALKTNERATCSYREGSDQFTNFSFTNSTYHEAKVDTGTGLRTFNAQCKDDMLNTGSATLSFTVSTTSTASAITLQSPSVFTSDVVRTDAIVTTSAGQGLGELVPSAFSLKLNGEAVDTSIYDNGAGNYTLVFDAPVTNGSYTMQLQVGSATATSTLNVQALMFTVQYVQSGMNANTGDRLIYMVGGNFTLGIASDSKNIFTTSTGSALNLTSNAKDGTAFIFVTRASGNVERVEGLLKERKFLDAINPSFGYAIDLNTFVIYTDLEYSDIALSGNKTLTAGRYNLIIENKGYDNSLNKTRLEVRVQ